MAPRAVLPRVRRGVSLGNARGAGGQALRLDDHENLDETTLLTAREQIGVLSAPVEEETDERRGRALGRLKGLVPGTYEAMLPVLQSIATAERWLKVE